ncbi:peptidase M61 [Luteimonas abyssi]|uniref:peptidase M61 n=1 Tax=Luteimonas abyssi TaxID=1247514 RepID=UPI000A533D6F|nr:peptidase M61 [Luteimonas abyssi]
MSRYRPIAATLATAVLSLLAWTAAAQPPALVYTLQPVPSADGDRIEAVEVTLTMTGVVPEAGVPLLRMPLVASNVPTVADRLQALDARDDRGALPLRPEDSGEDPAVLRAWHAERPPEGEIRVRYRAPTVTALAARGAAPPIELRGDSGAVSGGGATFLLRPEGDGFALRAEWDLSALADGAVGLSSLDTLADGETAPAALVDGAFFMAGAIQRYPATGATDRFFSAWQGTPPFDTHAMSVWGEALYARFLEVFDAAPTPYGVFLRRNRVNPGGGIGMHQSFVLTYDEDRGNDPEALRFTLAHEMFHTFQPLMARGGGMDESLGAAWFNEGLAVFYQGELPFRFGMVDPDAYLRDLNVTLARFYTNLFAETPNREVAGHFWEDTRIRTLPYDRGYVYFVNTDAAIRAASGGARSLDDVMLALRQRREQGLPVEQADWEALIAQELGDAGVAAFHAMLDGRVVVPVSDAFGPCFRRVQVPLRRYELGFEPKVLVEPVRIVRGLVPGSAAERAGVRDGDEILQPVGQDAIQGDQDGVLALQIRRDGQDLAIEYRPRGETVDTWQWARVPEVPDTACARPTR